MLYEQFSKPEGWIGKCVGWFMMKENHQINKWTLSFLDIKEGESILEIGFGSGEALQQVAKHKGVTLFGIDPSEVMVEGAMKRLRRERGTGQICLIQGPAGLLEFFDHRVDKIYAINNVTYWENPVETLSCMKKYLKIGGRIALTIRPHEKGATDETSEVLGGQLRNLLEKAGFQEVEVFLRPSRPNSSVCVVGTRI
ncbi:methyltransferase domain-containing protein [Halobacillus fulvus]|nr:methyltransferase domain-containing protein [Halobacillus fulvus]